MLKSRVLIVDDDRKYASRLAHALEGLFEVEKCHSENAFHKLYAPRHYDLLILDMRLDKDREGLRLLRRALDADPMQAAIVMTAYADMATYTTALKAGAMTYLDKSEFSPTLIARTVEAIVTQAKMRRQMHDLQQRVDQTEPLEIIGAHPTIRNVRELLQHAASLDSTVLITGEAGTGKRLAARNIHRLNGHRALGPFVYEISVSNTHHGGYDLFGVEQDSSSNAKTGKSGALASAKGGVLLIDGINGMSSTARSTLISLIEKGTCRSPVDGRSLVLDAQLIMLERTGSPVIDRILSSSDSLIHIKMPPLRERVEDIALLAQYILQQLYRKGRTKVRTLRSAALTALEQMSWPGNVRELQSAISYAAIRADAAEEQEIGSAHLPSQPSPPSEQLNEQKTLVECDYQQHLARAELRLLESFIETSGIMTKKGLAEHLGYNDHVIFTRRIRKCLREYPQLQSEYADITTLMQKKNTAEKEFLK